LTDTVSTVECVICFTTHLETPPAKDNVLDKDNNLVFGLDSKDWTYYRDLYEGQYAVICKKTHDAELAPKLSKLES
jgi:hypothetical protein